MGQITVAVFVALTLAGLALVAGGVFLRSRNTMAAGAALLLTLAGAWVLGPPGAALGLLALALLRRRRQGVSTGSN